VHRVQQDHKDNLETKDLQDLQVAKVQQDKQDHKDNLAHKDHLVLQGLLDSQGQLGLLVPKGHQVRRGQLGIQEMLALRDLLDKPVSQEM